MMGAYSEMRPLATRSFSPGCIALFGEKRYGEKYAQAVSSARK